MRVRSLAGRLLVLQLTVVAVTVAAGALITVLVARERTETAARDRSLTVARTVAALPEIPQALQQRDPSASLQPLAERLRDQARVSFITIMRPDGIRFTHPTPSLIGKRFVGTYAPAARGETVIETTKGTLGRSVRVVIPARENGEVVALVSVGVLTEAIGDEVAALLPGLIGLAALVLAAGSALSLLLARRVKRQTLGLEPQEITTLYAHHDATLHALREGVVVFDEHGRTALVNDEAEKLLGTTELDPESLGDDTPLIAGDRVLLASARRVTREGRTIGTVVTLRDRTEVETLARELGATKALADALRAQTHEAANRLHVIAGLVELGRTEEAIELAGSEAASAQDLLGRLGEGIEEPVLVALLLGKTANARERGVTLRVEPGARLCAGFPPTELATIVGNLIDNALDALGPDREGTVTVTLNDDGTNATIVIRDDGPGLAPEMLDSAFEPGVTTKPPGPVGRGLGLALVRRAVAALGGSVTVRNDNGAVFTVTLPHAAQPA
ncbi:MAG TPA: sensor histidine kinase, partial [Solirubrobacter sp.]|nr:sensor histidine kinase [Solirubrobacter sp.]